MCSINAMRHVPKEYTEDVSVFFLYPEQQHSVDR
jgi:hypothetical protein